MLRGAALAALLLVLVPAATAQLNLAPAVELTLSTEAVTLDAGGATTLEATLRNAGPVAGEASLQFLDLGGWTATTTPAGSVRLAAGGSAVVEIELAAPPAGEGASRRSILAEALLLDDAGRQATDRAEIAAMRVDPAPPILPAWWGTRDAYVIYALVAIAAAAIVALAVRARARRAAEAAEAARAVYLARETGIKLELESGPHRFGAGREMVYRVRVWNESDRPRVAVISAAGLPDGWRATPSLPRMPLSVGESISVTFLVAPPPHAPVGARAAIDLLARPEEATELDERVPLDVVAPDVRIPAPGETLKAVVLHRGIDLTTAGYAPRDRARTR